MDANGRHGPTPHSRISWLARLLLVALLVTACGGGDPRSEPIGPATTSAPPPFTAVGPFRVMTGTTNGPGTELMVGLVVAEGSEQLGPVFPDAGGGGGFLALGLVIGDPVAVYNDYLSQARRLGMSTSTDAAGGCLVVGDALACARTVTDPGDGEALTIRIERRNAPPGFVSHVALRYQPPGSLPVGRNDPVPPTPPTAPVPSVPLPGLVAQPADPVFNASVAPAGPAMRVEPGSHLVSAPGPCGCASVGWSAVLEVTGDPDRVLDAYIDQRTSTRVEPSLTNVGGAQVRVADLGLVTGGFTQFRMVTEGRSSYLLVAVAQL